MQQLDGVRAFAVAGVLVEHWLPAYRTPLFSPAKVGVLLFFVLSGFLISGILFRARDDAEAVGLGWARVLGVFYARRVLRIFPLYYVVVLVAATLGIGQTRHLLLWLLTYSENVLFAQRASWFGNELGHFWTLAVEEQFYLVWPLVALTLPRRAIVPVLIAAIVSSPLARIAHAAIAPHQFPDIQMHENLDSLGMGAVLAAVGADSEQGRAIGRWGLGAGLPAYVLITVAWMAADARGYIDHSSMLGVVLAQLRAVSIIGVCVFVIRAAAVGFSTNGPLGFVGRTLTSRTIVYLGTISYGIYVLHLFAPWVWWRIGNRIGAPSFLLTSPIGRLPVLLTLTVVGAACSWRLLENPINGLKVRFPYPRARRSNLAG